jgi:hypothetical protein
MCRLAPSVPDEPIVSSEVGVDGWETRRVQEASHGRLEWVGESHEMDTAGPCRRPPSMLTRSRSQPEFALAHVDRAVFE